MKQTSKAESLKRRIKLHEDRIRKLNKRLEVIEGAEITGNLLSDLKVFKNWELAYVSPENVYTLRAEIGVNLYKKSIRLLNGEVEILLHVPRYGSNIVRLSSNCLTSLWDFSVSHSIKDILMKIRDPSADITILENDLKRLISQKNLYDDAMRLFQSKLKKEKN